MQGTTHYITFILSIIPLGAPLLNYYGCWTSLASCNSLNATSNNFTDNITTNYRI